MALSVSLDEADLLLNVVRDAALTTSFVERFEMVSEALLAIIPAVSLCAVIIPSRGAPRAGEAFFQNNSIENLLEYVRHYRYVDPMGSTIDEALGSPHLLSDFISDGEFGRDAYTGDFLRRQRLRYIMGLSHVLPEDARLAVALQREKGMGDFTHRERSLLRLIAADLARAAFGSLLRAKVDQLEGAEATAGALVLDHQGIVLHADPGALELCRWLEEEKFSLDLLERDARRTARELPREGDGLLRRVTLSSGQSLSIRYSVLESRDRPRVLAVLSRGEEASFDGVAERIGLTSRERDVVSLLIDGLGNREIGYRLGISHNTVSVHLTRIYKKAGVEGRIELTRLMTTGCAP